MAYFDLQVNGYGGIDFNQDDLTAHQLHLACEALARDGVECILATIITESLKRMTARLETLVQLREQDPLARRMIAGLHVEGPFVNERDGYRGAHPADAVRPASVDDAKRLIDAGGGLVRLFTLAPDRDPGLKVTHWLAGRGITVAAGHCDPNLSELRAAIDAGLTMFTHLGNGCPMQMHRHDNIVQRVLSVADRLWITFIADGAHIPLFALANYLRLVGPEHAIIITDAIAPAGLGPGEYTLGRWRLKIGDDLVARSPDASHLVGAAMGLPQVTNNLREIGLDEPTIDRLTNANPRRAIDTQPSAA